MKKVCSGFCYLSQANSAESSSRSRILESDTLYYFLFQTTSTPATDRGRLKIHLYLNNPQKVMPSNTNTPNTIAAA